MTEPAAQNGLPKAYTPRDVEGDIYERWLAADVFAPDGAGSTADPALPPFTIIQPPPNVTGSLHLGHAQRTAVEDLMIRHARMRGHAALFLPGLDHASIAAQFVLDGILAKEGESRQTLGRERYLERMREFVAVTREVMLGQQRRVGASADWGRLRYTMDDGSAKAVRTAFERLYREGHAYRTEALVNWCPGCRTSVSDLEVIPTPETGTLWSVRYHLLDAATGEPDPDADDHGRHDPARDDPRRHGRRRPPGRPALRGARRADRADPVRRSRRADHRGRRRGPGVRDRRREDHAGPRPRRPRDGPATRPRRPDDPRRRRHGRRAPARPTTASTGTRPAAGSWPTSRRWATSSGAAPHEMVIGRCQRSDDVVEPRLKTQWFIRTAPLAERALAADPRGPDADPARPVREDLGTLDDDDPGLERQPPAVVGPPDPGVVLPGRPRDGLGRPGRSASLRGLRASGVGAAAGPGHLRHLVQLGPVAVLDARLAGRHARPGSLLPDIGHGDGLRHHLLLGRPDDDAGPDADRPGAVPHGLPVRPHPRSGRPEDVQDEGQRRRSARRHRRVRRGRPAIRPDPRRGARHRPAVRAGEARERPQLREQAVERDAVRHRRQAGLDPGR